MLRIPTSWLGRVSLLALAAAMLAGTVGVSADLDPKAITVQLPKEIKWTKGNGSESAVAGKVSDALLVAAGRRVLAWQDDFGSVQAKTGP